jgi:hypothetical protein
MMKIGLFLRNECPIHEINDTKLCFAVFDRLKILWFLKSKGFQFGRNYADSRWKIQLENTTE